MGLESKTTNKDAKKLLETLCRTHVGGYHINISKSKGCYAYLENESRLVLDMNMSLAARPLGYNNPIFEDEEYKKLIHLYSANKMAYSTYFTTDFAKAADVINRLYVQPSGFDRIFFIAGGAKAVEVAVHIAIISKVKKNIAAGKGEIGNTVLSLYGGFHGRGLGLRSITTSIPDKNEHLPTFQNWDTIKPPTNEVDVNRALQDLENKVKTIGPDHIAAFISEDGIQCGWGDRHIPKSFYDGVRKLADQYDFYMVNDAVQTGMYASGEPFTFQAIGAAQPDIIAGCKKSGTGYVLMTDRLLEVDNNAMDSKLAINSTFAGHLPDMITWAYVLQLIHEKNLKKNIKERGLELKNGLIEISKKHPQLQNPRGLGLMGLAVNVDSADLLSKVTQACHEEGLIIFPGSTPAPDGYAARFRPPLDITKEEVNTCLKRFEAGVRKAFS